MNIIIAFISTFLGSLWDIFFKKSLNYKINIWNNDFLWQVPPLLIFLFFYFFVWFTFQTNFNLELNTLFFIILTFAIYTIWVYLRSKILKVEKLSYLLPYANLEKIFTIIFSFFLFWDISVFTFFIIIFTIFVIILFTVDFKNVTFSKNILIYSFAQIFYAIWNLLTWYILLESIKWWLWISSFSFITTYLIIWTIILFIPFLFLKWFKELKEVSRDFYIFRSVSWVFWWTSWFLSLVIVSNLWLSMSILLSFIWVFTTLVFTFFILKEKIAFKDFLLSVIILALISVGFYFN